MSIDSLLNGINKQGRIWEETRGRSIEAMSDPESLQAVAQQVETKINDRLSPAQFNLRGERSETFTTPDGTQYRVRQNDIGGGDIYTGIIILRKPKTKNPAHNNTPEYKAVYFEGGGNVSFVEGNVITLDTRTHDYKSDPGNKKRAQDVLDELKLFEQLFTSHQKLQQTTLQ